MPVRYARNFTEGSPGALRKGERIVQSPLNNSVIDVPLGRGPRLDLELLEERR